MSKIRWTSEEQHKLVAHIKASSYRPKSCAMALTRAQDAVLVPARRRKWLSDRKIDESLLRAVRSALAIAPATPAPAAQSPVTVKSPPPLPIGMARAAQTQAIAAIAQPPTAPSPTLTPPVQQSLDAARIEALEHTVIEMIDALSKLEARLTAVLNQHEAQKVVVTPKPAMQRLSRMHRIKVAVIGCPNNQELERIKKRLSTYPTIEFDFHALDSDRKPYPFIADVVIVHSSVNHAWWGHLCKANGAERCYYLPRGGTTLTYEKIVDMALKQIALQSKK